MKVWEGRRNRWRANFLVSVISGILVLACGCGENSGDDGDNPWTGDPSLKEFAQALTRLRCEGYVECGTHRSVESCTAFLPESYVMFSAADPISTLQIEESVAAEIIHYDAKKAGECLRSFIGPECKSGSALLVGGAVCDEVFRGSVEEGQPCFESHECADSLECDGSSYGSCYAGMCVPEELASVSGYDCFYRECEAGYQCSDGYRCINGFTLNNPCDGYGSCLRGDSCVEETGVCEALPGSGEACEFRCLNIREFCGRDGFCELRTDVGEPCYGFNGCLPHSTCIEGVCVPKSGSGEICVNHLGLPGCLVGTYCNEDTGDCETWEPLSCPL